MTIFDFILALSALSSSGIKIELAKHLSLWDCTTGMPVSFPESIPYAYESGQWFWVSVVASGSDTNYKPDGTSYTGTASTTVESDAVSLMDIYVYDGNGKFNLMPVGTLLSQFYKKSEVDAMIGTVKTSLDSPVVDKITYNLGSKSETFPITLPSSPTTGFTCLVMFDATASFTPTITGGTLCGESIPTTTSGKHYDFMLFYNGSKWEFSSLEL